jgi:phage gpG-like protein
MAQAGKSRAGLQALKAPIKQDQKEHAQAQEGPEGKWKPRSPASVARAKLGRGAGSKRRMRGPNRKLLASLPRRTIQVKVQARRIIVLSKVPWAGVHQHGGTAGRGAKIPARPFLWFSQQFLEQAQAMLIARVAKAWAR